MKKSFYKSTVFVLFFLNLFAACNPDDINNLLITRDNYLGTWSVSDHEVPITKNNYTANITADPNNSTQIIINNFHQFGSSFSVFGVVSGKNLTIGTQAIAGVSVYGDGELKNTTLTITYFTDDGADINKYVAVYTK